MIFVPTRDYIEAASDAELDSWFLQLLNYIRVLAPKSDEDTAKLQLRSLHTVCDEIITERSGRQAGRVRV